MKRVIILIPIYNDWESLNKLILEIDDNIKQIKNFSFDCFIINDASNIKHIKLDKPKNLGSLKIFNMKINKGHARCNAFGIRYVCENENFDYLILMDGDGEDRPIEIKSLINMILQEPDKSVVAKRVKRSEGSFFQLLYQMHKLLTLVFTGKKVNFGNYSCLTKKEAEILSSKKSLWSSYSGTVKKYLKSFNEINSIRGSRYFGPSKMSILNLLLHSFSIIAVFRNQVLLRSILMVILLYYFHLGIFSVFLQITIVLFNLLIFIVSFREDKKALLNCQDNLDNIKE